MPMDPSILAKKLWDTQQPKLPSGAPDPNPSPQIKAYAQGFINMLKAGKVILAPGMVTCAAIPPAGPMAGGQGINGKITVLLGPTMAASIISAAKDPAVAAKAPLEATAIATYFMASAQVSFAVGMITGQSTATPPPSGTPGPLAGGMGQNGKISGVAGAPLAGAVGPPIGGAGPLQVPFYQALCDFVMQMAQVAIPSVQGVCTPAGVLTLGAGLMGQIS